MFQNQNNTYVDNTSGGFIWGTKFSIDEGKRKIENFLTQYNPKDYKIEEHRGLNFYMEKLLLIKETSLFYLVVSAEDLYDFDTEIYYYLVKYPAETILLFDQIVNRIFQQRILSENERTYSKTIRIRIVDLKQQSLLRHIEP